LAVCRPDPTLAAGASRSIVVVGLGTATSFLPSTDAASFRGCDAVAFEARFVGAAAMILPCDES